MEGQGDDLMLVQPRAPKQKVEIGLQVDDVELHIEYDRANSEGNNQNPQRVMVCVVILVFRSSMHIAKARVHRLESGSLLVAMSEKEDLTRKHLKKGKGEEKKKIRQNRSRHQVY